MTEVRIGILGSGFMGLTHAEAVAKYLKHARLVAIAGGSRAPALAARYGVEAEQSAEALVARRDIDALIVATPHAAHATLTILAARHGKHVLVEKPMATTLEECDAMLAACHAAGVNLMAGQMQRYRKANAIAKQLIIAGRIGRVLMLRESQIGAGGIASFPAWQNAPANVGVLLGHGIHNFDRMRWLTGNEASSVSARVGHWRETANVDLSAMVLITFASGAIGELWMTWECPKPAFPQSEFRAQIMGEDGLLDIDAYGKLQLGTSAGWETVFEQPPIDYRGNKLDPVRMQTYADQDQEFVNSIAEGRPPAVTGEDGRAAVQMALAAYRSSELGETVHLTAGRPL